MKNCFTFRNNRLKFKCYYSTVRMRNPNTCFNLHVLYFFPFFRNPCKWNGDTPINHRINSTYLGGFAPRNIVRIGTAIGNPHYIQLSLRDITKCYPKCFVCRFSNKWIVSIFFLYWISNNKSCIAFHSRRLQWVWWIQKLISKRGVSLCFPSRNFVRLYGHLRLFIYLILSSGWIRSLCHKEITNYTSEQNNNYNQ